MSVRYADHLRHRMALRQLSQTFVEEIFRDPQERFRDTATGYLVALRRRTFAGKERDVIIVYQEEQEGPLLITCHPLRDSERARRVSSGRWVRL